MPHKRFVFRKNPADEPLEFSMPAGSTVMDAPEYVTQDTDNTFGAYYAAIDPIGAANNYISRMQVTEGDVTYPLGEFTCGSMSGWMYWVNGELPMVGAGNYMLNDKCDHRLEIYRRLQYRLGLNIVEKWS